MDAVKRFTRIVPTVVMFVGVAADVMAAEADSYLTAASGYRRHLISLDATR